MRPAMTMPSRALAGGVALSCLCVALAACGRSADDGPLPSDFGRPARRLFGCADVGGLYRWPPVAGEFASGFASNRRPWADGYPAYVDRVPMQLWVDVQSSRIVLRTRRAPANGRLARQWGYVEHYVTDYRCTGGRLEFKPREIDVSRDWGRGTTGTKGFVLQRLKDGALAIGTVERIGHRTAPAVQWGDQSMGEIPQADRVMWTWSKLERIADAPEQDAR